MPELTALFLIDPPEFLDPATDTSMAFMRESLARGHEVVFATLADLHLENGRPLARVRPVAFPAWPGPFTTGPDREMPLEQCHLIHMRKDPPVDAAYLAATHILDRLPAGIVQVNPPAALRDHCEKLIPGYFPDLQPESLVTCSSARLESFLDRIGHIVVKPLEDCSGRGIIALRRDDPLLRSRLREVTQGERRFVEGQRFLPEIADGDKRVLLLGGEILGWVRRVPGEGNFLSNVNAGGRCRPCELTAEDRRACARIGAWLAEHDIHFAGVDLVGPYVLEVNITSPSCLREINDLTGRALEKEVIDYLESLLGRRRGV